VGGLCRIRCVHLRVIFLHRNSMDFYGHNLADLILLFTAGGVGMFLGLLWWGLVQYLGDR